MNKQQLSWKKHRSQRIPKADLAAFTVKNKQKAYLLASTNFGFSHTSYFLLPILSFFSLFAAYLSLLIETVLKDKIKSFHFLLHHKPVLSIFTLSNSILNNFNIYFLFQITQAITKY